MTVEWESLIDERALASLMHESHRHFARPVAEALVVFLSGLPSEIQSQVLAKQAELPLDTPLADRLGVLGACSPVLQKLGQTLARDKRLALELRCQLHALESMAPTTPLEDVRHAINEELGPLQSRGITLEPPALAEASVAVVIPFRQVVRGAPREGVFKVLKPGIQERLRLELELLGRVGDHLDRRRTELGLPEIEFQETFERIRERLLNEVQLGHEQRNLVAAASFYHNDPAVLIPEVYSMSTSRVTAMQRVRGAKITDHNLPSQGRSRQLAGLLTRRLIARPLLALEPRALFHSDPHAGNLMLTEDGRLAILDWSLVGHLDDSHRSTMVRIMLAAVTLRRDKVLAALNEIAEREPKDPRALGTVVDTWLRKVRRGSMPSLTWAVGMLDDAVHTAGLSAPADLLLFRKSLLTLEGVTTDLGADRLYVDLCMTCEFLKQFASEIPRRWCVAADSRRFGTHLSNEDLARTMLGAPWTGARFWAGQGRDLLRGIEEFRQRLLNNRPSPAG